VEITKFTQTKEYFWIILLRLYTHSYKIISF